MWRPSRGVRCCLTKTSCTACLRRWVRFCCSRCVAAGCVSAVHDALQLGAFLPPVALHQLGSKYLACVGCKSTSMSTDRPCRHVVPMILQLRRPAGPAFRWCGSWRSFRGGQGRRCAWLGQNGARPSALAVQRGWTPSSDGWRRSGLAGSRACSREMWDCFSSTLLDALRNHGRLASACVLPVQAQAACAAGPGGGLVGQTARLPRLSSSLSHPARAVLRRPTSPEGAAAGYPCVPLPPRR